MFSWIEISSKAIEHNLKEFRRVIGRNVLLMPVIKSNAYGHGFLGVAKICDKNKEVDRICVVNSDEALNLLENGVKKPIMILSFYDLDSQILLKLAKKGVIFPLYSPEQAKALDKAGEKARKKIKIHLKIDTGASRLGILSREAAQFYEDIKKYKNLDVEGVWSHFASSEDDSNYTEMQINEFLEAAKKLKAVGFEPRLKHIACSAASVLHEKANFSAVRLGLGLYGLYSANSIMKEKVKLIPALSWRTKIIQIKRLSAGTKIGYGGTYTASRPTKMAVIPVGYWDGYDRKLSNRAMVLVKGQKCPVLGRICMNMAMIDVTAAQNVKAGDTVTLIGKDGVARITADEMAKWAETINYEVVTRVNPLLPRFIKGSV